MPYGRHFTADDGTKVEQFRWQLWEDRVDRIADALPPAFERGKMLIEVMAPQSLWETRSGGYEDGFVESVGARLERLYWLRDGVFYAWAVM